MPSRQRPRFSCASCDAVIAGAVTFHVGLPFCCAGCVAGGPCTCSYDTEPFMSSADAMESPSDVPGLEPDADGGVVARPEATAPPARTLVGAVAVR